MIRKVTHLLCIVALLYVVPLAAPIIPFNFDNREEHPLKPMLDTQGIAWQNDLNYLTYLILDEHDQLYFKTYPFTTINVPGFYRLADNVTNQITISVSNVTLDLNGHTVSGGTHGIVINSGLNNVTIKNGTVRSVNLDGIQINSGCTDITIDNVGVKQALVGLNFDTVVNGLVRNCDMNINTTGIQLDTCANILVENCTANANVQAGYDLLTSTTCSLFNCKALSTGDGNNNSSGDVSNVYGFVSTSGNGNIFEGCIANSTQNLVATSFDTVIAGFALKGSESCSKIVGCEVGTVQVNGGGQAIGYGIFLEDLFSTIGSPIVESSSTVQFFSGAWSPDGKYIIAGEAQGTGASDMFMFRVNYDGTTIDSVTQVDQAPIESTDCVDDMKWHPSGQYVAVALDTDNTPEYPLQLLELDPINEKLQLLQLVTQTASTVAPGQLSWSPDGKFLAVPDVSTSIRIYEFDQIAKELTQVDIVSHGAKCQAAVWSPDGNYLAISATASSSITMRLYRFDRTTKTLIQLDTEIFGTIVYSIDWSADGTYIAALANSSSTLGIYRFENETITQVDTETNTSIAIDNGNVSWSADGKYLVVTYAEITPRRGEIKLFLFDRSGETITEIDTVLQSSDRAHHGVFSPDGRFVVIFNELTPTSAFEIYDAIQFPQQNVIMDNKIYCIGASVTNMGFGIYGSSIGNAILQNTVTGSNSSALNYAFVTNVFNQLFGNGPTLLQNLSMAIDSPVQTPLDIPTKLRRLESLADFLIENLL